VRRIAPLLAGLAFLVLVLALFFLLVFPKMGEIGRSEEELEAARDQEQVLQSQLARLKAARQDLPEIQRELAGFRRSVPPVADLPGLINQLQQAAATAGVDFFSITPAQPVPGAGSEVALVPAQIQVIGSFFPVDEFMFRLETLARASRVNTVAVAEGPEGLPQIDVILDTTFFTTDPNAGPGAAVEAGPAPGPSPSPSPSPGASPAPGTSPTPGTSPSPTTPGG
jgi:Tfp pilus assembly protein PilO